MDTAVNARPWLDHHDLLDPAPMHLETGIQRREDGTMLVAVRTDLHGCKGRMLDWWFTFFETTSTSAGGIRSIMSSIAAGTRPGSAGAATTAPASMRWNRSLTFRRWRAPEVP